MHLEHRPETPAARSVLKNAVVVAVFLAFLVVVHHVSYSIREWVLLVWIFASLPLSFIATGLSRNVSVISVCAILTSFWFFMAYCGDIGGPYAHDIPARLIGAEGIACAIVQSVVCAQRFFRG